jgi:flavin-binding protein dodecin
MSIAKTIEITASSKKSFDDAISSGIAKAAQTLKGISGAWIADQEVEIANGKVTSYIVRMRVTFVVK